MPHTVATILRKTQCGLNVSKDNYFNQLISTNHGTIYLIDSVNIETHTHTHVWTILFSSNWPNCIFHKGHSHIMFFIYFYSCFINIKLFVFQCSLCHIPFLSCVCKNLRCICGGNKPERNNRKIRTRTHSHAPTTNWKEHIHLNIQLHVYTIPSGPPRLWLPTLLLFTLRLFKFLKVIEWYWTFIH